MNSAQVTYTFNSREPSVLTEIYLPKKSSYQANLYNTLTKGFNLNYKEHFKGARERDIKDFLFQFRAFDDYEKLVESAKQIFFGYSIYEVDGVFCSEKGVIFEERTQVIRIVFKPDYSELIKQIQDENPNTSFPKDEMRTLKAIARETLGLSRTQRDNERKSQYLDENSWRRMAFEKLCNWADQAAFFLIGYIVYELSIGEYNVEEEIWVTSIWTFDVNVINKQNDSKVK